MAGQETAPLIVCSDCSLFSREDFIGTLNMIYYHRITIHVHDLPLGNMHFMHILHCVPDSLPALYIFLHCILYNESRRCK